MRRRRSIGVSLIAVVLIMAFSMTWVGAQQESNLLQNGSFDDGYPVYMPPLCAPVNGGINFWEPVGYVDDEGRFCPPTIIPGWTVGGGGVDWHNGNGPTTGMVQLDGSPDFNFQAIDLNSRFSNPPGTISQTAATTPQALYLLSYYYAANAACENGPKTGRVIVDPVIAGTALQTFSTNTRHGFPGWDLASLLFTAIGPATTITFIGDTNPTYCGPAIDKVDLRQVPTTEDECKNDGWQRYGVFKNEGDCVSFVATHSRNSPAGL